MRAHGAFILARYSTDRQNPDSIEVQVEKCTDWCDANSIPILGVFADLAVSGMKDTRPQYELMMQQLREERADTVVIYDQSRMFRKMTAWFAFRDELEAMGVAVISVTQPMIGKDLRDPTNFLTEGSMALFNQIWALQTRQKVIEKMRYMARSGQHTGGRVPLGYQIEDGRLAVCESEAQLVRRIFREYADGLPYREIIAGLNADGLTTKSGKPFGSNSLHDMLKNEKYIGTLIYGKVPKRANGSRNSHAPAAADCIRLEDAIPAIVDRDTWEKVQVKMAQNQRQNAGRPATVREYPLKGKVFCGECKSSMSVTKSKYRYYYYACSGKQRLHNCDMMPIKVDELENAVAQAVRDVLGKPGNTRHLIEILRAERDRLQGGAAGQLQALLAREAEVKRQLDNALDAVLQGLNSPALTQKIRELEGEKQRLAYDLRRLKEQVDAASIPEDRLADCLQTVMAAPDLTAILSIVGRVEVFHDAIRIWTLLDTDFDGQFTDLELLDDTQVIRIEGFGSPAPQNPKELQRFLGVLDFVHISAIFIGHNQFTRILKGCDLVDNPQTICLLNDSFPPFIDGVANAVMNYAKNITDKGGNAMVITPDHPEADDSGYPYGVVRYPSIDARKFTGYMAGVPFSPEIARRLENKNVTVLHSHCPIVSTLMGRQLRQIVDAPLVMTYHTKFDIDIANVLRSKTLQTGSKKILVENIRACDEIWTVSQGAGENLRSLGYEGDYIVMPNGVDMPLGRISDEAVAEVTKGYDLPAGVPVYLFVGRMMWYKGLRLIIDALSWMRAADRDFRMVFIGKGSDLQEIMDYAAQWNIADKCIFTGAIHHRDVLRAWYCRADLFLFPSTFDTNGLVVREAAACSLASVLISGSCAAEGITDGVNGFLAEENAQSLFRVLMRLGSNREKMRAVGENAADQLYFPWEAAVNLAIERYAIVSDRYKSGGYPRCRKPSEYFLMANGELMEDLGQLLTLRDQLKERF